MKSVAQSMIAVTLFAVGALMVCAPSTSLAQPAAAIGQPLPDPSLRDGTVTVRVIAGDRTVAAEGVVVTLSLNDPKGQKPPVPQTARTDASGHATFTAIAAGTLLKASTPAAQGEAATSTLFPMPDRGGVRVMLTTAPLADAVDAPMAGGSMAGGRPPMTPRMMSGQSRPEAADPRDTLTVRVSYDDFADASSLAGIPVTLIGYRHDQAIGGRVVLTDPAGRAVFAGLDARGATSYFAMTLLPRNGMWDRVVTDPVLLDGSAGYRTMLSAEKRASSKPAVDDLARLDDQPKTATIGAGVVRVVVSGVPEVSNQLELVDALTGKTVATTEVTPPLPDLDSIAATFAALVADPALVAGTLALALTHTDQPLAGLSVIVSPVGADSVGASGVTDTAGNVTLTGLPIGVALTVAIAVDPDRSVTSTVTLPAAGGVRVAAALTWFDKAEAGARFTGVATGSEHTYAVRATMRKQLYISAPFQMPPDRGASITLLVMPRVMFTFSLSSWVDDVYLGVRGNFAIRNASWAPYLPGTDDRPDELVMPLPKGFISAVVRDEFQEVVGIDPSRGFVIRRPIPPSGYQFVAGFSMKIQDGDVHWSMPLPLGAFDSGIEFRRFGAMTLELPTTVRGIKVEDAKDQRGQFFVMSPITILPNQSMTFDLHGLPQEPAWRTQPKIVAGVIVLALLAVGLLFVLWRPAPSTLPKARFDALLNELTALEIKNGDPARRAALMAELESLYRTPPHHQPPPQSPPK